jgi:uncharacterized BrkB/YihY/UPF0761 family membrane protein
MFAQIALGRSLEELGRLAEAEAELVGLDEVVVVLWSWLRVHVVLFLLAVVLSVVYRFAPATNQPYRLV